MKLLYRYIVLQILVSVFSIVWVFFGLDFFMQLVSQAHQLGQANYGFWQAIQYVLLSVPGDVYQLFPILGFLGCLFGLGRLSSGSELTAMRASGFSKRAILVAALLAGGVLSVGVSTLGETVVPRFQRMAYVLQQRALGHAVYQAPDAYWLKQSNTYYQIKHIQSPRVLGDITAYQFSAQGQLQQVMHAQQASRQSGHWLLSQVRIKRFSGQRVWQQQRQTLRVNFNFNPRYLFDVSMPSTMMTLPQLWQRIQFYLTSGGVSNVDEYNFWHRVLQPITTIILICLGVPFIFGSLRDSSMGARLMTGVVVGFLFYMMNLFFGPICLIFSFSPIGAAVLPLVVFILAYLVLWWRSV